MRECPRSNCNRVNADDARFCGRCGLPLQPYDWVPPQGTPAKNSRKTSSDWDAQAITGLVVLSIFVLLWPVLLIRSCITYN